MSWPWTWTWDAASPSDRAAHVRQHIAACCYDDGALGRLFCLTEEGVKRIRAGDIWRPEYSTDRA